MIGLRPFLLRSAAAIGEGGMDDVAAFWTAVEWNAYLRRDNMLSVCVGAEAIVAKESRPIVEDGRVVAYEMPRLPDSYEAALHRSELRDREVREHRAIMRQGRDPHAPPPPESWE